jgi:hypothetical protein
VNDRKRPAEARLPRSGFLRVTGAMTLTLRVDPPGPGGAMLRGPAASVSHLERALPAPARAALGPLRDALARSRGHAEAISRAHEALLGAGFTVDRRDEPSAPVRRHPATRLGRPDLPLVDHELLGLALGLRQVAKRMSPPGDGAERVASFEARGFVAVRFGVTTHGAARSERDVVLVATEPRALEQACEVERALVRAAAARADDSGAVRAMGALLGYPTCCVERFAALGARDDASLAGALLGACGVPTPFESAFTVPPFVLVSHAPCRPTCEGTLALVHALLGAMRAPERASYARLSSARWGIDDMGLLVRSDLRATEQIDVSDPALASRPCPRPEDGALHWLIETFALE